MKDIVTVYVEPDDDVAEKYKPNRLTVKWRVVVSTDHGFVKANAELVNMGWVPEEILSTWEVRELSYVPAEVTEMVADKLLYRGDRRKEQYTKMAEAV